MTRQVSIAVVGNPNCGKTSLFNVLTGSHQHVGNWPGVTVEKKTGSFRLAGLDVELVDLPGTYTLESSDEQISIDEKIARDYIADQSSDLIVNIIDAGNIERNLYLTTQLLEMRVPMLVVVNKIDVLNSKGIRLDAQRLAALLGCPVVVVSTVKKGYKKHLLDALQHAVQMLPVPDKDVVYAPALEAGITRLMANAALQKAASDARCDLRWLALRVLEEDSLACRLTASMPEYAIAEERARVIADADEDIDILSADARYQAVTDWVAEVLYKPSQVGKDISDRLDSVILHRFFGIPIFLLVMYAMFMFTINFGGAFIDFFDQATGALFVDQFGIMLASWGWPDWLVVLLAEGAGGGVQVVATFIPIVGCLFLFLSALEDSGYMARAAFVMDRMMRALGLPGKSFVPMIVGFGCNVPAIMASRTLENPKDRILTNMMNPFMSCGARLPVYALFAAAFFPVGGQNLVFGLYLIGIMVAIGTGLLMRHTLFQGKATTFIMELPPYHLPRISNVLLHTWDRLKKFVFNAGKVIVPMVLVLNFLNALGTDGRFGQADSENSVLSSIGKTLTPVFAPMGVKEDNWPATVGIFTGILAKEAVVGTLDALYGQIDVEHADGAEHQPFALMPALTEAAQTIPDNLLELGQFILDPLGLSVQQAAAQELDNRTYRAMQTRFDQVSAFAYLLFILLYTPCVAATAAIYRETGPRWCAFIVAWTTGLAYISATVFYQLSRLTEQPGAAASVLAVCALVVVLVVITLRGYAKAQIAPVGRVL
ncbi:MAG: Fe(2+) transporter permease subunit FeoB [Methylococcales bacterium]|nr:Fe(2+) transporter permease subunit FeoB [Methylococcales bacterium]